MENINRIQKILSNTTGNIVDVYITLYRQCISGQSEPHKSFQFILECAGNYDFQEDDAPILTTKIEISKTGHYYYRLLCELVFALAKENLSPEAFYEKLYSYVFDSDVFPTDDEIRGILLYFLAEKIEGIPYYQAINLVEMTNQEYKDVLERIDSSIEKAIYMLNRGFASKTEEASQIFQIMSGIDDEKDKIVFLAAVIGLLKKGKNGTEDD